jgi:hypothetical protein
MRCASLCRNIGRRCQVLGNGSNGDLLALNTIGREVDQNPGPKRLFRHRGSPMFRTLEPASDHIVTKMAISAVSALAGSSTWTATASTCPTSRRTKISSTRPGQNSTCTRTSTRYTGLFAYRQALPGQGGGNNGSSIRSAMARACYRVAGIDWAACTALTVPPKTVATRCGGAGGVRPGHEAGRYDAGRRLAGGIRGPAQGTRRDTLYRPCLRDGNSCSCVARRRPARRRHQARSQDDVRPAGATKRGGLTAHCHPTSVEIQPRMMPKVVSGCWSTNCTTLRIDDAFICP